VIARIEANARAEAAKNEARIADSERAHKQRMAEFKAEAEERRVRERAETDRKERDRKEERKRDDAESVRREAARSEELTRRMGQEQEHGKSMMTLIRDRSEANDPMQGLARLIEQFGPIMAMAKDAGLDKLIGGGGPQSWADTIGQTVQAGVQGLIEIKKIEAQVASDSAEDDPMLQIQLPPSPEFPQGRVVQMPESQLIAMQQQQAQRQAQQGGAPPQHVPDVEIAGPQQQAPPSNQNPHSARAQAAEQLPAEVRKQARHGLRQLVAALDSEQDDGKWPGMILGGLSQNPAIFHYIQVRAIRPSLLEAGATEGLASKIMHMIEVSGQVPADIPRV
jgi:hypothetical protein